MIYPIISESEYQDAACSEVAIIHHLSCIYLNLNYQDAACSEVAIIHHISFIMHISESEYQDAACSEVARYIIMIIHHHT